MEKIIELVKIALIRKDISPTQASLIISGNRSLIRNLFLGQKTSFAYILKICEFLDIEMHYYLKPDLDQQQDMPMVDFMGVIEASQRDFKEIKLITPKIGDQYSKLIKYFPDHKFDNIRAFKISGDGLSPRFKNNDIIYLMDNFIPDINFDHYISKDCLVEFFNGHENQILLKILRRPDNGIDGYFNLESINPKFATLSDIKIISAKPIRFINIDI